MIDKVEQVAKAISEAEDRAHSKVLYNWDEVEEDGKIIYRAMARAAIETICRIDAMKLVDQTLEDRDHG